MQISIDHAVLTKNEINLCIWTLHAKPYIVYSIEVTLGYSQLCHSKCKMTGYKYLYLHGFASDSMMSGFSYVPTW